MQRNIKPSENRFENLGCISGKLFIIISSKNDLSEYALGIINQIKPGYQSDGLRIKLESSILRDQRENWTLHPLEKRIFLINSEIKQEPYSVKIIKPNPRLPPFKVYEIYCGNDAKRAIKADDVLKKYYLWASKTPKYKQLTSQGKLKKLFSKV